MSTLLINEHFSFWHILLLIYFFTIFFYQSKAKALTSKEKVNMTEASRLISEPIKDIHSKIKFNISFIHISSNYPGLTSALIQNNFRSVSALFITWKPLNSADNEIFQSPESALFQRSFSLKQRWVTVEQRRFPLKQRWVALIFDGFRMTIFFGYFFKLFGIFRSSSILRHII